MRYILLGLFMLWSSFFYSQQKIIDSLNIELVKYDKSGQKRLDILNSLSYHYHLTDPEKGLQLSNEAIILAKQLNIKSKLASAYKNKGINYNSLSNDSLALLMYDNAIEIQEQIGDDSAVAKIIFNKGLIYFGNSDYLRANECNQKAYEIFEKERDSFLMAKVLNSIGINQMYRALYPEAVDTYLKALKIYDDIGKADSFDYGSIYSNIGILHKKLKNYDLAIEYQNAAMEIYEDINYPIGIANTHNSLGNIYESINNPQEAISFYNKAYTIMNEIGNQEGMANALTNIGIAYTSLQEYNKSLEYLNKTKKLYQDIGNTNSLAIAYSAIGDNFLKKSQQDGNRNLLNTAKKNFQLAYDIAKNVGNLDFQIQVLNELAYVNEMQANYKQAYYIKVQADKLKDSLSLSEKKTEIAKLEAEFNYQRKEIELNNKHKIDQAVSQANLSREKLFKNITLIGSSLFILIFLISFLLYKRKNEAITKALIAETELKALRAQMNPHFIFNSLNSISDYVLKNDKDSAINYLSKFSKLMRQILENSEKKLIPLDEDISILKNYLDIERKRFGNKFSYTINIDKKIDVENTLIPPLITQPFIENSIVHGFRDKEDNGLINIDIAQEKNIIIYSVEDNGVGRKNRDIDEKGTNKISLGTKITENRIDIINKQKNTNGKVEIIDKAQGTLVKVSIPLQLAF